MRYTSVQRRIISEQSIKSDVLRDWIDKLREAFDRTMFYKNFIEGLAAEALEEYIKEHPEDRERAEGIREPIKKLIEQAQIANKLIIDIDQKIGRSAASEKSSGPVPSPETGEGEAGAEAEAGEAEAGEAEATGTETGEKA